MARSHSHSLSTLLISFVRASSLLTAAFATTVVLAQTAAPAAPAPVAVPAPVPATAPAATPAAAPVTTPKADAKPAMATGESAMEGKVAYYGGKFNGRKTASGERFNASAMTMAHKTLPFGTMVRVTNVKTKKSVVVRVNDRGPSSPDRIGDLTRAAAVKVGAIKAGFAEVTLVKVGKGKKAAKNAKASKKVMKKAKKK
jgi:rare lipoprotein A